MTHLRRAIQATESAIQSGAQDAQRLADEATQGIQNSYKTFQNLASKGVNSA